MGTSGCCMVCIGKGMENVVLVVCERGNGQCELRSLMIHDELRDMGRFMPMKREIY
jgi:hypothetical protein